jgi:1,4-alpha-glucan branching enzyme
MLFGDFTDTHDIAGAMAKLDYLQTLGINAVELMPIQEFDGNESWGYNPTHYFALDKAYGTREQYKTFINECHKRGIAVIIDVVYNHSTGASPLAQIYWNSSKNQTAANNPYFFETARHDFNVFHDINHGNKFMQDLIKRSLVYMIEEYNVDGFRFDLSKGFTDSQNGWNGVDQTRIALIKDYAKAIKSADPESYVILEHWGQYSEESEYVRNDMHPWKKMNEAFCETAMGWSGSKADLSGNHPWLDNTWGASGWVTFMESHDEERMAYKQEKYGHSSVKGNLKNSMQNLALNAVCFLGTPGPKMIWQMGELGYNYNKWCSADGTDYTGTGEHETDRKPVKWDYLNVPERKAVYDVYSKMNDLRKDNPELFGKGAYYTSTMSSWPLKTFELSKDGKKVCGYANYHGDKAASQNLNIPSGTWTDILSGQTVQGGSYTLHSGQALVLVNSSVNK